MFYALNGFIMWSRQKRMTFYASTSFCDFVHKKSKRSTSETKKQNNVKQERGVCNLQWTTSLHLSSIALSGMNGFSARHVKYFPSSSTTGINVRTLNDWLPVSENCGKEWKMIWKLEKKLIAFFLLSLLKLSCYQWNSWSTSISCGFNDSPQNVRWNHFPLKP